MIQSITKSIASIIILIIFFACEQKMDTSSSNNLIENLLAEMSLDEKAGQLNFLVGDLFNTGPTVRTSESEMFDELIREGKITGLFNIHGAEYTARLQKIAMEESRLKIPLLFGADIIHGFKTVFPIPLAEAASWDLEALEAAARIAAIESAAAGINYTFAPMVDISRDARWGRVAEGAGEDPYLASRIAEARVRGFQGKNLADANTIAACLKHFAAYGAPFGGRDYNTVDISDRQLREIYLPPFKAGIDAGAATIMTAFNELNEIPATGNKYLLNDILRKEWAYDGMIVSDWNSIGEMIDHGYARDKKHAAALALIAGTDVDMMSEMYVEEIPELVRSGKIDIKLVDHAVRRVLELKYKLGLFDNPYQYSDAALEKTLIRSDAHLEIARDVARKSIVLLKNENKLLPLNQSYKNIAVIGPLANNKEDMNGTWSFFGEAQHPVSILEGLQKAMPNTKFNYASGCNLYDNKTDKIAEAVALAKQSEITILVVGESAVMSGEGASRADIGLPGVQQTLVEAIYKTGKPVVVLLVNGRPLSIPWIAENIPAIVETWTLGSEAGNAIADVLTGAYNPSGKLPMTFPRHVGQVPIFYNHKNTGRNYTGDYTEPESERVYRSKYRDVENSALYPFGYGLSYSDFVYSNLKLDKTEMSPNESIEVSITLNNTSDVDGDEVVQLYIRNLTASVTRPVRELKDFRKVRINAGESKTINFSINASTLTFLRSDMTWGTESGVFKVFVGGSSDATLEKEFSLKD
jgi:beta-glucosidase